MRYGNYELPQGRDLASITFEDICWQYFIFRCNSTGVGRDKQRTYWHGVKTKLGEIEEKDWCKLAEALIEYKEETQLLNHLIQWCTEHNYTWDSAAEVRKEALQLHLARIFDNPLWVWYLPFNKKYRPEVWRAANIVFVQSECCQRICTVTQEQVDQAYTKTIPCPHCGKWSKFTIIRRSQPEPPNPCLDCGCNDPDMGCTMSGIERSYGCPLGSRDDGQAEVLDG